MSLFLARAELVKVLEVFVPFAPILLQHGMGFLSFESFLLSFFPSVQVLPLLVLGLLVHFLATLTGGSDVREEDL